MVSLTAIQNRCKSFNNVGADASIGPNRRGYFMYHTIPRETILFISLISLLIVLTIQFIKRQWKFKKYLGSVLLYSVTETYVYNVFGDIQLGEAQPFDQFYYSKIPFGNLFYNHVQFDDIIMKQYRHDFFVFFALTTTFIILFSFIITCFFSIKNLKKLWLILFLTLEIIQFMLMELSYHFLIMKEYPLVFDTGAFILVPLCLAIGIFAGSKLRKSSHDKD